MSAREVTVQTPRGNERTGTVVGRRLKPAPQTLDIECLVDLGGVRLWVDEREVTPCHE